jgi:hypothetical protein
MGALRVLVLCGTVSAAAGLVYCTFRMARDINRAEGKRGPSLFVLFGLFPVLARHARLVPNSNMRVYTVLLIPVIFLLGVFFMMLRGS